MPLIRADAHITVYTIKTLKITPRSQTIFNPSTHTGLRPGSYMVESSPVARCPQLLVVRTLFKARKGYIFCPVSNQTERTIESPQRSPTARVAPVDIPQNKDAPTQDDEDVNLTVAALRAALEQEQVSFKDTAMMGPDLHALIRLLNKYRDRLAVKLTDLKSSDLLKIGTGDACL